MQPVVVAVLLIVAVLTRPIAVRLWRAGRIPRRTAMILVFGRFPTLVFTYGVITGAAPLLIVALSAFAVVPDAHRARSAHGRSRHRSAADQSSGTVCPLALQPPRVDSV